MLDLLDAGLPLPARGLFTTRSGGTSAPPYDGLNLALHTDDEWRRVHANRDLLSAALGLSFRELVFADQVHGTGVRVVTEPSARGRDRGFPATDALVTTARNVALVILGADCPPVLLAAEEVVGAAHVGRAGLAGGVLREVVRVMREHGAQRISARIGPGICGGCYEVPEALAVEVEGRAPGSRSRTRRHTPSIDLAVGARRQLDHDGVDDIEVVGGCTAEQGERFFSYRRDGVTGRHAGVVWLP